MTLLNDARGAIYGAFTTAWGSTSAYAFDSESSPGPTAGTTSGLFVRLVVRHNSRQQETLGGIGNRLFESGGSVIAQCFAPLDAGVSAADSLAQAVRAIFEGKTLQPAGASIRFTSSVVREIGPTRDSYQINVESLFTYTERK